MDRLEIIMHLLNHITKEKNNDKVWDHDIDGKKIIIGKGVGYLDEENPDKPDLDNIGLVFIVNPDVPDQDVEKLKNFISIESSSIKSLKGFDNIPEKIEAKIKYEKRKIELLPILDTLKEAKDVKLGVKNFKAGDKLYNSKGKWIGTGGFVFSYKKTNHIVSNYHVYLSAEDSIIRNSNSEIAMVSNLREERDSGLAQLHNDVYFNNCIPKIGIPTQIKGGVSLGNYGQKYGSATGYSCFYINWIGKMEGFNCMRGVNKKGQPIVGHGDSGSIMVGKENDIRALIFGGSEDVGEGPGGRLYDEIWAIDISIAFNNEISIP